MSCILIAPTSGAVSTLFDTIYNDFANKNESRANELYSFLVSDVFKSKFGNWVQDYKNGISYNERTMDNGEPMLFKDTESGESYFLDKELNRIPFPYNNESIVNLLDSELLDNVINYFALNYLTEVKGLSFTNIDLTKNEYSQTLVDYIQSTIDNRISQVETRISELEEEGDFEDEYIQNLTAQEYLPVMKDSVHELKSLVANKFREFNITMKESTDFESDTEVEDQPRDSGFGVSSFQRNNKENVRTNAKLRLSLIPNPASPNIYFGGNNFLSFDDVFGKLSNILTDNYVRKVEGTIQNPLDEMVRRLSKFASKRPEFTVLVDLLTSKDTSENLKLELYQAFNTQKNDPIATEITRKTERAFKLKPELKGTPQGSEMMTQVTHSVKNIAQSASKSTSLRKEWNYYLFNNFIKNAESKEQAASKIDQIANRFEELGNRIRMSSAKDNTDLSVDYITGVTYYEDARNSLIKAINHLFGYQVDARAIDDLFEGDGSTSIRNNALLLFDRLAIDMKDVLKAVPIAYESQDSYVNLVENSSVLKQIGDADGNYKESDSDATANSNNGKIYLYQNKAHMNSVVNMWRNDPSMLEDLYNRDVYARSSKVIQHLLAVDSTSMRKGELIQKRLADFKIQLFTDHYEEGEGNASKDLAKVDYAIDYANKVLKGRFGASSVKTTLQADKTSDMHINMDYFVDTLQSYNPISKKMVFKANTNVIKTFRDHFYSELNRMIYAERVIEQALLTDNPRNLIQHFHYSKIKTKEDGSFEITRPGNAIMSQYFPELSRTYSGIYLTPEIEALAKDIQSILYDGSGNIAKEFSDNINENSLYSVEQYIRPDLASKIDQFINLTLQEKVKETHKRMKEDGILDKNNIDTSVLEYYKSVYNEEAIDMAMASDFHINAVLRNIEFSKLFSGDLAYYKNLIDYKKRVPATNTDGITPMLKPGQEYFKYAVVDAIEIGSPFLYRMTEAYGEAIAVHYEDINSADAQSWITTTRWKTLQQGLNWSDDHQSLYDKMTSGKPEKYTAVELKIAAQPLKGVYFWRDDQGRPLYFKYSQAVLTPMLVKGTPLQQVYDRMMDPDNGFDELLTADAVKVGSPFATRMHNGHLLADTNFNVKTADSRGWKLQQDLAPKTFKPTALGSQIQKNAFAALKHDLGTTFTAPDGRTMTGKDLANQILTATKGKSDLGLARFKKELGVDADGNIQNIDRVYESLISELKSRGGDLNIVKALEKRLPLNAIPQVRNKMNSVFASMAKSRIIKIQTNGGSFIQMSNFGMSYTDVTEGNTGVILHPDLHDMTDGINTTFEPSIRKVIKDGKEVETITPSGIFISGSFIAKYIPDYRKYTSKQLFGYTNEEGEFVEGVIDRRIIENVIGYRIPNQGLASNDALQIVGILPEENGDTIVAYTGITKKTGSD